MQKYCICGKLRKYVHPVVNGYRQQIAGKTVHLLGANVPTADLMDPHLHCKYGFCSYMAPYISLFPIYTFIYLYIDIFLCYPGTMNMVEMSHVELLVCGVPTSW